MKNKAENNDIFLNLKKCSLFEDLTDTEISTVSLLSTLITRPKDTQLFSQGENSSDIYVVASGSVDVFIKEGLENKMKIGTYQEGSFFGELGYFLKETRIGTALTTMETTVVVISKTLYDLPTIFRTPGFVGFLKRIANRAGTTLKDISQAMTASKNSVFQALDHLPEHSVEDTNLKERRKDGNTFDIDNLLHLHIFKRFKKDDLATLCSKSFRVDFKKGELIFSENSVGSSFYIIVSGAVLICKTFLINGEKKHAKLALLPPGRPLGHLSFFDSSKRSASAIACERTTVMEIELETYTALVCTVQDETDVAFELLEGFIDDLSVAMLNTLRALVYASSRKKLNT